MVPVQAYLYGLEYETIPTDQGVVFKFAGPVALAQAEARLRSDTGVGGSFVASLPTGLTGVRRLVRFFVDYSAYTLRARTVGYIDYLHGGKFFRDWDVCEASYKEEEIAILGPRVAKEG